MPALVGALAPSGVVAVRAQPDPAIRPRSRAGRGRRGRRWVDYAHIVSPGPVGPHIQVEPERLHWHPGHYLQGAGIPCLYPGHLSSLPALDGALGRGVAVAGHFAGLPDPAGQRLLRGPLRAAPGGSAGAWRGGHVVDHTPRNVVWMSSGRRLIRRRAPPLMRVILSACSP